MFDWLFPPKDFRTEHIKKMKRWKKEKAYRKRKGLPPTIAEEIVSKMTSEDINDLCKRAFDKARKSI